MTKYAACAAALLAAAAGGCLVLIFAAWIRGYPLEAVSVGGVLLSVLLLWLGSLSILGVALLVSTIFGDVIKSVVVTAIAMLLLLSPDNWINYAFWNEYHAMGLSDRFTRDVTLFYYWFSEGAFQGGGFTWVNFLICLLAAVVPLLAAIWNFNRKAY